MTTICHIVLTIVSCVVNPATPAPTPAAAIAILTASLGPSRVPDLPFARGGVEVLAYDPSWPFTGSFAPTWVQTDRRLEPWLVAPPPYYYGLPMFGGAGPGRRAGSARPDQAATPPTRPGRRR
jgi:hypothetical protein